MVRRLTTDRCAHCRPLTSLDPMNLRRSFAAGAALLAVAGVTLAAQPTLASPVGADRKPAVNAVKWKTCPTYSDEVLEAMMPAPEIPKFKALWARTECG